MENFKVQQFQICCAMELNTRSYFWEVYKGHGLYNYIATLLYKQGHFIPGSLFIRWFFLGPTTSGTNSWSTWKHYKNVGLYTECRNLWTGSYVWKQDLVTYFN